MIKFQNLRTVHDEPLELHLENSHDQVIQADNLLAFPALIDPHVHFRTPGLTHKEDWLTGARAAIRGGYTTVFDMPNTLPPTITTELLTQKKAIIDQQLREVNIPLRYHLFFGADKNHLTEISKLKNEAIGIKIFMGCSTGNLVMDDDESLEAVFSLAAQNDLIVAVHAEDEALLRERKKKYAGSLPYHMHSTLRDHEVAARAVEKAIHLAKRYQTRLYILHVSTEDEISLIREAKQQGIHVFAETTPHHLFLNTKAYERLKGKAVVNPPLRADNQQAFLFSAIKEKIIDTIGSDHAPHTLTEKEKPYGECPSGMPGIEFVLPLLLNAYHEGMLSLDDIYHLTSHRPREIFKLENFNDWVIVDLDKTSTVKETHSKCGWTPYEGIVLKGWPVYTILKNRCYKC